MRNPMRDPMRGVDLMVLGYVVGASTPSQVAPGNRGQFASRAREPASRLLSLMARTPSFETQSVYLSFLYSMRDPMRGTTDFQDLDRGDDFEKGTSRKYVLTYNFYLSAKTRAGRDTGVIQGGGGAGYDPRPTTSLEQ